MEKIIKKAIEGGFNWWGYEPDAAVRTDVWYQSRAVLDPLFWQALGKACEWKKRAYSEVIGRKSYFSREDIEPTVVEDWLYYAHQFHEINLTENFEAAIKYLEGIIN